MGDAQLDLVQVLACLWVRVQSGQTELNRMAGFTERQETCPPRLAHLAMTRGGSRAGPGEGRPREAGLGGAWGRENQGEAGEGRPKEAGLGEGQVC